MYKIILCGSFYFISDGFGSTFPIGICIGLSDVKGLRIFGFQCVKLPRVTENGVNSNDLNINGMFNREYSFT